MNDDGIPEGIEIVKVLGKVRAIIKEADTKEVSHPFDSGKTIRIPTRSRKAPPAKSPFDVTPKKSEEPK